MGISYKKRGPKYSQQDQDRIRQKIIDAKVIQGLMEAWDGKRELSATQLAIGLKAFDKLIPNLQSQQVEITDSQPFARIPEKIESIKAWEAAQKPDDAPPAKPGTRH